MILDNLTVSHRLRIPMAEVPGLMQEYGISPALGGYLPHVVEAVAKCEEFILYVSRMKDRAAAERLVEDVSVFLRGKIQPLPGPPPYKGCDDGLEHWEYV